MNWRPTKRGDAQVPIRPQNLPRAQCQRAGATGDVRRGHGGCGHLADSCLSAVAGEAQFVVKSGGSDKMAPRCHRRKFPSRFPRGGNKDSGKGGKAHAMSATGDDAIAPWPNRGELANERDPTFSLGVMLTPAECGYMTRFSCDFIPGVMVVSGWI